MMTLTIWTARIAGLSLLTLSALCHAVEEGDTTTINITGTLVDAPECTVNNGNGVDVDFGDDVVISRINSGIYRQEIQYSASCGPLAQNGLSIAISGSDAGFGTTGLLSGGRDGLGIQLYSGTTPVRAGESVPFNYPAFPVLSAELVKNDSADLAAGTFNGTATMVIAYQ